MNAEPAEMPKEKKKVQKTNFFLTHSVIQCIHVETPNFSLIKKGTQTKKQKNKESKKKISPGGKLEKNALLCWT